MILNYSNPLTMNSLKEYIQERIEFYEKYHELNPWTKWLADWFIQELRSVLSKIEEIENNK